MGATDLGGRLATLGRRIGEREASQAESLARAREFVAGLRERVAGAIDLFHREAAKAGAPHLEVEVSEARTDDKHLHSVQFDLRRGRHRAIVTAKSRGDVTLVGPFRDGKVEGPCRSFPFEAADEIEAALGDFLESFLEAAAVP